MSSHPVGVVRRLVSFGFVTVIASCAEPADDASVAAIGSSGTGIMVSTTASGFWERRATYDWTIDKSATPDRARLATGESVNVQYTLTATRAVETDVEAFGSRGEICVTNNGSIATEGLAIVDQVQANAGPGGYADLAGASQNVRVDAQLAAGESRCFPYQVEFTPVAGARYRNTARVTITNHSGHLGVAFGPGGPSGVAAGFTLPTSYTWVYRDASAHLEDSLTCPTGLACSPATNGPWDLTASDTIMYTVGVTRVGGSCGTQLTVANAATLTESTTGDVRTDSFDVVIDTGACPIAPTLPVTNQGCTPGYWKNHPVSWSTFWPSNAVSSVFPESSPYGLGTYQLIQGLAFRGGPDEAGAAEILLRAAIAALLNATHTGVLYPRSTADVIDDVETALASHDRATMITLATALDLDNNLGCPLH